jgi:hypothetical protein
VEGRAFCVAINESQQIAPIYDLGLFLKYIERILILSVCIADSISEASFLNRGVGWTGDWDIQGYQTKYEYYSSWSFNLWNGCTKKKRAFYLNF